MILNLALKYMGVESALLGSIVTTIGGLAGVVLAKCRCVYTRGPDGGVSLRAGSPISL